MHWRLAIFQHFSFGPPLETMKKKVVYIRSNFERLHEIKKEAYTENFSCLLTYLIGKAEIPIHHTTWAPFEQALLKFC